MSFKVGWRLSARQHHCPVWLVACNTEKALCSCAQGCIHTFPISSTTQLVLSALHVFVQEVVIVGGLEMQQQAKALARRPHVVVATPGRLKASVYVILCCCSGET